MNKKYAISHMNQIQKLKTLLQQILRFNYKDTVTRFEHQVKRHWKLLVLGGFLTTTTIACVPLIINQQANNIDTSKNVIRENNGNVIIQHSDNFLALSGPDIKPLTMDKLNKSDLSSLDSILKQLQELSVALNFNDFERVKEAIIIAMRDDGEQKEIHIRFRLATFYLNARQYDKAIRELLIVKDIYENRLNERGDNYSTILSYLGFNYQKKGDYDNAIKFYQAEYDCNSGDHERLMDIAMLFALKNNYDKAIEYYTLATCWVVGSSKLAAIYHELGVMYYNKGDYDAAIERYGAALGISLTFSPDIPLFFHYYGLGSAYIQLKEYDRAIEFYNKGVDTIQIMAANKNYPSFPLEAKYAGFYRDLGWLYERKKDYQQALRYYQEAFATYEKFPLTMDEYGDYGLNEIFSDAGINVDNLLASIERVGSKID